MKEDAQSKIPVEIRVDVASQQLTLLGRPPGGEPEVLARYPVSTSGFGLGSEEGSNRTPLGAFAVAERIGEGAAPGTVFSSRMPTGEVTPFASPGDPRDLVVTRILWLTGLEPHNANTLARYIYIHGTNHEETIGTPCSHGCVRMRNPDVIALFDRAPVGTPVFIA